MRHIKTITILIICWVICTPVSAEKTKPKPATNQLSGSSGIKSTSLDKKIEEGWLLWKLDRIDEARSLSSELLHQSKQKEVYDLAAAVSAKAEDWEMLERLIKEYRSMTADPDAMSEYEIQLVYASKDKKRLEVLYLKLLKEDPENYEVRLDYMRLLVEGKRYREARNILNEKLIKDAPKEEVSRVIESGSDSIKADAKVLRGPAGLYETNLNQKLSFWHDNKWKFGLESNEVYFVRDGREGLPSVNQWIFKDELNASYFEGDLHLNSRIGHTRYNGENETSLGFKLSNTNEYYSGMIDASFEKAVDDPVEGIELRAKETSVQSAHRIRLMEHVHASYQFAYSDYAINGGKNSLNGRDDVGHRLNHEWGLQWAVFEKPYLSFRYFFREGGWNKAFEGAETVLPLLESESLHGAEGYLELRVRDALTAVGSVTHGRDRKRDVHFTNYVLGLHYWLNPYFKWSASYEYDYGDSGTLGSGNTSIVTTSMEYYW